MRTFLAYLLLMGGLALSPGSSAAPYLGAGLVDDARIIQADDTLLLVQKRTFRGSIGRSYRPRLRRNLRRFPAARSRIIRSGSNVLRDRYDRPVRTQGNNDRNLRDIGAGRAVIAAQSFLPGTVLGVRRNGNVYNVKILDRNRVRIIHVNAATGQVMR